jgi:hypothetical protein
MKKKSYWRASVSNLLLDFLEVPLAILGIACVVVALAWGASTSNKSEDSARVETTKSVVEALKNPDLSPETRKLLEKKLVEAIK